MLTGGHWHPLAVSALPIISNGIQSHMRLSQNCMSTKSLGIQPKAWRVKLAPHLSESTPKILTRPQRPPSGRFLSRRTKLRVLCANVDLTYKPSNYFIARKREITIFLIQRTRVVQVIERGTGVGEGFTVTLQEKTKCHRPRIIERLHTLRRRSSKAASLSGSPGHHLREGRKERNETNLDNKSTTPGPRRQGRQLYEEIWEGKKEINLNSSPPVKAPVNTYNQPEIKGVMEREDIV